MIRVDVFGLYVAVGLLSTIAVGVVAAVISHGHIATMVPAGEWHELITAVLAILAGCGVASIAWMVVVAIAAVFTA